jgi:hypothetical protein
MTMENEIKLNPCPFCGATVHMDAGRPFEGCGGTPSYTFVHPGNECVVRRAIVFVNRREAMEWAAMWNRRAEDGE